MLQRALSDPLLVFRWVVADSGYGHDPVLRAFCHDRRLSYVFAVPIDLPLVDAYGEALRPDDLLTATENGVWERRPCGYGGKGERYWDFAAHQVTVKDQPPASGFVHVLLIRWALKGEVHQETPRRDHRDCLLPRSHPDRHRAAQGHRRGWVEMEHRGGL
jgi:hypothetical protein